MVIDLYSIKPIEITLACVRWIFRRLGLRSYQSRPKVLSFFFFLSLSVNILIILIKTCAGILLID